jgi:hypothetical protein
MKVKFFSFFVAAVMAIGCFVSDSSADHRTGVRAPFVQNFQTDDMGGPDSLGYTWKDSQEPEVDYIFLDTTHGSGTWTQVSGLGDDNFVGPFTMGMNFRYYYYNVNRFWIGSNGYIMFGPQTGNMASPFPNMPASAQPNNMIAALGSDLNFNGAGNPGKCYWYSNNADTVIISFYDVPFWQQIAPTYTGSNTFQIVLTSTDSSITINYKNQTGITSNNDITAGIEDIAGNIGLQYIRNVYPTSLRSVKFFYPDTVTYQITDAAVNWINNSDNGAISIVEGDNFTISANFGNLGNQSTPTFKAVMRVRQTGSTLFADTIDVAPLSPSTDTTMFALNAWTAGAPGTYEVTVTNLFTDLVATNNFASFEVQVLERDTAGQQLKYDNGTSGTSVSWSGGAGHVAQYFVPAAYPITIDQISFFIATTGPGFAGRILDDDGPNGLPGTQLFTQSMTNPAAGSFTNINVSPAITITDGGFYVVWTMEGEGIALGEDVSAPVSNRSFEGFSNDFSPYRNGSIQDPMIRARIHLPGTIGITNTSSNIPERYSISQNYPNPFNPTTKIDFAIPKTGLVKIAVYDILGRQVSNLVNQNLTAGTYSIDFNGANLNSGIFFYRIEADGFVETKKMLLIK